MNWKRVAIFIVALVLATMLVSFPFGFVAGFLEAASRPVPSWLFWLQAAANLVTIVAVLAVLGYRQRERVWVHGVAVMVGAWLATFPLNVVLLKQPVVTWFLGIIVVLLAGGIGLVIGTVVRKHHAKSAQA